MEKSIQSSIILRFLRRRIKFNLCLLVLLLASLHVIQTGCFLFNHFTENEDRNHMIKLDMNFWQEAEQFRRRIPRHIHQIWLSTVDNEEMYEKFRVASKACIELHSNYNYTLWTHTKILNWLKIHYSWFIPVYQSYRYDMQRIDAMKYFLLFHFGGIYIDLDVKCKVQDLITTMISPEQREIEPDIIFHMGTEGISANTDMIAAKRFHPFFKLAVSQLQSANRWFYLYHLTIILSAGPTFLYGITRQFPMRENFYYIPNDSLYGKLIEGVGGGTWYGKDSVFLIYFMENKLWSCCFLLIIILLLLFIIARFVRRKRSERKD